VITRIGSRTLWALLVAAGLSVAAPLSGVAAAAESSPARPSAVVVVATYDTLNQCLEAAKAYHKGPGPSYTSCRQRPDFKHDLYAEDGLTDR
jgi:hypothetical protein